MSRWSTNDLARVSAKLRGVIADPLAIPITARVIPRRGKYGNERISLDGFTFDSRLEARRYQDLKLLAAADKIRNLEVHKKFYLHVNNIEIGFYEADFVYTEDGKEVVEDCKGVLTTLYSWKKRHMCAEYNINIIEIKA